MDTFNALVRLNQHTTALSAAIRRAVKELDAGELREDIRGNEAAALLARLLCDVGQLAERIREYDCLSPEQVEFNENTIRMLITQLTGKPMVMSLNYTMSKEASRMGIYDATKI